MIRNLIWVVVCLAAFEARAAGEALSSIQSGNWSDAGTWSAGRVPGAGDTVTISAGHTVVFQVASPTLAGVTVETGAALTFAPGVSATLQSTGSVIVRGTLSMKPSSLSVVHRIAFVNVNEAAFVGGGMEVVPTDVGLWVRDGQLDLQGTPKTAWTRLAGGVGAAATSITLEAPPVGWSAGDEISIVPTEAPSVGDMSWSGFDLGTVTNVSNATVVLNRATSRAHPMVNNQWRAEVLNLTRNVRIEGTGDGSANPSTNHRAHIWIRSDKPQTVNYVAIRYMGPRRVSDGTTESILGRYALHFHHSMEGTRGSVVRGTVVRDAGAHAFASHMSHGTWIQDSISYNTFDEAYWWDPGDESHDIVYERCVAAIVRTDPEYRGYNLTGFMVNQGLRNVIRDSVAVGVQGNVDSSGFSWPEQDGINGHGIWNFSRGNIAHNNKVDGIFAWQNDHQPHVVANYVGYHNGEAGIDHGAYSNGYHYESSTLYGNGEAALHMKAISPGVDEFGHLRLRFDNFIFDGGGQSPDLILSDDHNADGTGDSTVIRNSLFRNATNALHFRPGERGDWLDLELCTFNTTNDVTFDANVVPDNRVRKQSDTAQAFNITPAGRTSIPLFVQPYVDESNPQVSIASPTGGATVTGTVPVNVYTYDLGGMKAVELYVDNSFVASSTTAPFTLSWSSASVPNGRHDLQLIGIDAAGLTNTSARTTVFVSNSGAPPPTSGKSLWPASAQAGTYSARDTQPIEVGVKFKSDVAGAVTAIRFYRHAISSGGYTVHLWSSAGVLLGSGRGTDGPDTPGWTEIKLSAPVSIAANTVYVASYFSRTGQASNDENFFASSGVDNSPLHAPSSSAVGGNGVFSYCSTGCFPSQLDHATNYWVTPVFVQP
ncbi:DUF4082 domain-containing protein [Pyxidicoccus parkwayensis]|uniref:DUF4082 domain-containing protein n=1 Tax=Pyxidicoccus parkwayensis TaxID=2813578 RepID=A0ABX7NKQ8_9BACT|nr:DUF4082 domain-containing protein [Pyxidicoccus parkwaysis]QSQ19439.1 DUF4082 domain-containing protein [Pyxidicoccus parkwaysis]